MNVFEDLVIELQEENLLEKTVVGLQRQRHGGVDQFDETGSPETNTDLAEPDLAGFEYDVAAADETAHADLPIERPTETEVEARDIAAPTQEHAAPDEKERVAQEPNNEKEFFKKSAVNEVSSLQMVEHVFTAVEREHMKIVPQPFDDINAKRALHTFVNITDEPQSEEYKEVRSALMRETQAWGVALTERDRNIDVSNLRRYCENSRPALSSQALLALARFYRNSPYSEAVRAKFDFIITRLFSRPTHNEKRVCLFNRTETIGHINTLYSDWSSVPLYSADDESKVMLTALSFDDLSAEAEASPTFDQLIASNFFGRLRLFKESISELFYAPSVTAAAIESNIRIGNTYVTLLDRENRKMDAASIESKYSELDLQTVSEVTGRTFDLAELIRLRESGGEEEEDSLQVDGDPEKPENFDRPVRPPLEQTAPGLSTPLATNFIESTRHINRWLITAAIVLVFVTIGLYVWADFVVEEKVSTAGVEAVAVEGTPLGEHIMTGKVSGDTFYGLMRPSWDTLTKEKREEFIRKVCDAGKNMGYKQVSLVNKDGKPAGFASGNRIEVMMP